MILTTSAAALIAGGGHVDAVIAGGPDGNQSQPRKLAQNPPPEGSPAEYGDLGAIEPPDYLVLACRDRGRDPRSIPTDGESRREIDAIEAPCESDLPRRAGPSMSRRRPTEKSRRRSPRGRGLRGPP